MPRALLYFACEKATVDQTTNSASATSIIEEMHIAIPRGVPPPPANSFIPNVWFMLSLLEWEPGDFGKTFESQSRLVGSNGEELLSSTIAIAKAEPGKPRHRVIEQIMGFPIWVPGKMDLKLMFRLQGKSDFKEIAHYSIVVTHDLATIS